MIDKVVEEVCEDLKYRSSVGIQKYGKTLERDDYQLKDWLQHAYEEVLDTANYLKAAIRQNKNMLEITKSMFIVLVDLLQKSFGENTNWTQNQQLKNSFETIELLANALDKRRWYWIKWWCFDNEFGKKGLKAKIDEQEISDIKDLLKFLY
ncbi:MAG: hypothetical protein NZZ41_02680 [Candidatus Dojkabacteria bacterium]|nr:hypothetical protein [Candidatus Dojkabacteria bacterium]